MELQAAITLRKPSAHPCSRQSFLTNNSLSNLLTVWINT